MGQLVFNEGKNRIGADGLPDTCYFLLSSKTVAELAVTGTLAGGVSEISGTGYHRKSQALPAPSAGVYDFEEMLWDPAGETDWSKTVKSVVMTDSSDGSGKAIFAWDLSKTRDMSTADVLHFTPELILQNEGGG